MVGLTRCYILGGVNCNEGQDQDTGHKQNFWNFGTLTLEPWNRAAALTDAGLVHVRAQTPLLRAVVRLYGSLHSMHPVHPVHPIISALLCSAPRSANGCGNVVAILAPQPCTTSDYPRSNLLSFEWRQLYFVYRSGHP